MPHACDCTDDGHPRYTWEGVRCARCGGHCR